MRIITILSLFAGFFYINFPFLVPIVLAGIFALGLNDLVMYLKSKINIRPIYIIGITIFSGFALFWVPMTLAIYRIVVHFSKLNDIEAGQLFSRLESLKIFLIDSFHKVSLWTGIELADPAKNLIENVLSKAGAFVFNYSTHFLTQVPSILLSSFVFFIFLFVTLIKASELKKIFVNNSPFSIEATESILVTLKNSCSMTLFSTLFVGLIQASIIGMASLIFNQGDFLLVLTITFLFSFIPVFGAAPVGALLTLLAFIDHQYGSAIGLAVFTIISGSVDNLIKPIVMGGSSKISPAIGFTCVVGAVIMLGLPGLLLGPVIMNLFFQISPLIVKETL